MCAGELCTNNIIQFLIEGVRPTHVDLCDGRKMGGGWRSIVMRVFVCLCVCLFIRENIKMPPAAGA